MIPQLPPRINVPAPYGVPGRWPCSNLFNRIKNQRMKTAIESAMERAQKDMEYHNQAAKKLRRDAEKAIVFDEQSEAMMYESMAMEHSLKAGEYEIMLEALKYYQRNEAHQE